MARATFTARRLEEIGRAYEAFLAVGFPVTLEGNDETLQVAREVDRTNWLIVQGICEEGVFAGFGDVPDTIFLRTTSNVNYYMSFNEALTIIRALRSWGLAAWANWGRLKDLATAAQSNAELRAIDLSEGWP